MSALRTQLGPSRPGASSRRRRTSARTPAMRCTPSTRGRDLDWLAAESAAAALGGKGPDEALCVLWESVRGEDLAGRLAVVRGTGHPAAGKLARALTEFIAPGVPRSIDQGTQLKVTLKHTKPAIWRSVRLPVTATRADLH